MIYEVSSINHKRLKKLIKNRSLSRCIPYKFDVHFQQLLAALVQREESWQDFLVVQFSCHLILTRLLDQSPGIHLCPTLAQ